MERELHYSKNLIIENKTRQHAENMTQQVTPKLCNPMELEAKILILEELQGEENNICLIINQLSHKKMVELFNDYSKIL
jgi:hypothetical protein